MNARYIVLAAFGLYAVMVAVAAWDTIAHHHRMEVTDDRRG